MMQFFLIAGAVCAGILTAKVIANTYHVIYCHIRSNTQDGKK